MKPEIENLKVWMSGRSTTGYQRALGMREFEQLLSYVNELEQLRQPRVSGALPLLDNILKEEMSAEMRTWLMELRLLIGNDL
jgi:hypothetical protein